jgi:hypothetical protein
MRVSITTDPQLPRLGYVGQHSPDATAIRCGPWVETRDALVTDGVWDGPFEAGPSVASVLWGTALRANDAGVRILTSHVPIDRLFLVQVAPTTWVFSNSLPLVLLEADDELSPTRSDYRSMFHSASRGLRHAPRWTSTGRGRRLRVVYGEIATLTAGRARFWHRPAAAGFDDFTQYRARLATVVERTVANATDAGRRHPFSPLPMISAGYDSSVVAVLAAEAGVHHAVSLRRNLGGEDSAARDDPQAVADALGLMLTTVDRGGWRSRTDVPEAWVAASGLPLYDVALLDAEPHLPQTMMMAGFGGDAMWSTQLPHPPWDLATSGYLFGRGLSEHRLSLGYTIFAPPLIDATAVPSVARITSAPEMAPWTLGIAYDRPIARRIIESAGVPRGAFGVRKLGVSGGVGTRTRRFRGRTSSDRLDELKQSMSAHGAESFIDYLDEIGYDDSSLAARAFRLKLTAGALAHRAFSKVDAASHRTGRSLRSRHASGLVPRALLVRWAARVGVHSDYTALLPHWGTSRVAATLSRADAVAPAAECGQ